MSGKTPQAWMRRLGRCARQFLLEEDGPTAVEYAVMLSLILVACLGSFTALSNATAESFDASAQAINEAINR
jgi:pilus assembly protein Flp/PilA